jgi:hypothetical protein
MRQLFQTMILFLLFCFTKMSDFTVSETYDKVERETDFKVGEVMLENQVIVADHKTAYQCTLKLYLWHIHKSNMN